jgi:ubiquinone/menaquinone biosynthesis C-methylase UbiE
LGLFGLPRRNRKNKMGTIYQKKSFTEDGQKKLFLDRYEKEAIDYDQNRYTTHPYWIFFNKVQTRCFEKILNAKKSERILDVGCGTGRITEFLLKKGYLVSGVEPAQNMVEVCKEKLNCFNPLIKKGDIENIPFKDNSFDKVYTMHVLFHLPKSVIKAGIAEMYRVVKPEGKIYLDFSNKNGIWTQLSLLLNPRRKTKRGERHQMFTITEIRQLFKGYNYKLEGIFSYARTLYNASLLRPVMYFLEQHVPIPVKWRSQIIVVVKKCSH